MAFARSSYTERCLSGAESAALLGFPPDWKLPLGSRAGLRAVGNAVPPPLARAVMACATKAAAAESPAPPAPPAPQESAPPAAPPEHERCDSNELAGLRRKLRRLAKRVDVLEGCEQGSLDD